MRKLTIVVLFALTTLNLKAQYRNITFDKTDVPSLQIVQIDFRDLSTLVHFQFTNENYTWICTQEDFYIQDKSTFKKYRLLNSINLPFCDKVHRLESVGQKHNFTLEFEKIPNDISVFDIIENAESGFNFYGVRIDTIKKEKDFIDIASFVDDTPVKEYGYYYKDGRPIYYYKYKGVTVAVFLYGDNNYGKYYQANILVSNLSGKDLNFNPDLITARMQKKEEVFPAQVLSYNEYMKKVQRRQNWNAFAVAFSESMAASNAGYSSSASSTRSSGYSSTTGSASGYVGNTYGSVYGSSTTYGSTYSTTYSQSYDGAAAYAAQQNANRNVANYQYQQYSIKKSLSEGYLRLNTLSNETEYVGFINIPYKKVDNLEIVIPFYDTKFVFVW